MPQCGEVKTGLLMQPDQEPTRSVVPQHDLRRMSFGDRPQGSLPDQSGLAKPVRADISSQVPGDAEYWHILA